MPATEARQKSGTWRIGFDGGLAGWTTDVAGGTPEGRGSVTAGSALLREGDSFLVSVERSFEVPANPAPLVFRYTDLQFDTADPGSINDAFEASLLGPDGKPLVHGFAAGRDAFFNVTEDAGLAVGPAAGQTGDAIKTVTVDLAGVLPGTTATIRFRLVNNDVDTGTSVRILSVDVPTDNAPPAVTAALENDTAPHGPAGEPYRADGLTHDPAVRGSVTDDRGIARLEAGIDGGPFVDITAALSGGQFRHDPGPLAPGPHRLTIRATDTAGQARDAVVDFVVNRPPVVDAGPDRAAGEGTTVAFDGSGSADAEGPLFDLRWQFHDGTAAAGATASYRYGQDGAYAARLTATDTAGSVVSRDVQVTVANLPAAVEPLPDQAAREGESVGVLAPFADPGILDSHTATVDWGDGTTVAATVQELQGAGTAAASHRYRDDGTYTVTMTVTDDAGAAASRSFTVAVANVPPALSLAGASAVAEGSPYTLYLASSDPGADTIRSWTITWGDGAVETVAGNPATVSHTYPDGENRYTITATASDEEGTYEAGNALAVRVLNVAPTLTLAGAAMVDEGAPYTLRLASGDPGADTITGWTISWGDGSVDRFGGNPGAVTHVYRDGPGEYTVRATADDEDGAHAAANELRVRVDNVAPELTLRGADTVAAGSAYTLVLGHRDPGDDTLTGWVIRWGDGTEQHVGGGVTEVTHVYPDGANTYTIRAAAADEDGQYPAGNTLSVRVTAVRPTLTLRGDGRTAEGSVYTLHLDSGDPAGGSIRRWTVDWDDGTVEVFEGSPSSVTHVYADGPAGHTISATATDGSGTYPAGNTVTVQVDNVAPALRAGLSFEPGPAGRALDAVITGHVTDPGFSRPAAGRAETFTVTVDWGDGTVETVAAAVTPGGAGEPTSGRFVARHAYSQGGAYRATVTAADDDGGHAVATFAFGAARIDVVPSITLKSGGVIPVKVFSDPGFDATLIDVHSLRFGPAGARETHGALHGGSDNFVMTHFDTAASGIRPTDTAAFLTGRLADGTPFVGVDAIRIVPGSSHGAGGVPPATSPPGATKFFVVDAQADTAFRYAATGAPAGSFRLDSLAADPRGVASNAAGDTVWVVDGRTHQITVQGPDGSWRGSWRALGLESPQDITTDGTDVWVVDASLDRVVRYAAAAGLRSGVGLAAGGFALHRDNRDPSGIVTDGQALWVTDQARDEVFVYDRAGTLSGRWRLDAANADASGLTLDPTGASSNLWVVDRADRRVYAYAGALAWRDGSRVAASTFALAAGNALPEGIADPPSLTVSEPAGDTRLGAGETLVLTGRALDGGVAAAAVRVNGQAVGAVDVAGNFFHRVQVAAGTNAFTLEASDAAGATTTSTVTVEGAQRPAGAVDFTRLEVVSGSAMGLYGRTSWHEAASVLYADFGVRNVGRYAVDGPVLIGVTNISDPSVRLRGAAGTTPDGIPYFDMTSLVAGGTLEPGASSGSQTISFFAPGRAHFTYDLVFFAGLNRPPRIATVPDVEALGGRAYAYDVDAVDPDGDALTFSLAAAPAGMEVDADTGKVTWSPPGSDVGTHTVIVRADDGRGGSSEQRYVLTVIEPPPNRPPVFTSLPAVSAGVNTAYSYQATAADADGDALTFGVVSGPAGLTINASSGLAAWTPAGVQVGTQSVVLEVSDGRGGTATQSYTLVVGQRPGNTAPVIVSNPVLVFDVPRFPNSPSGDVTPVRIDLDLLPGQTNTQTVSLTLPSADPAPNYADIVFVVDESGSMSGEHDWLEDMVLELDAALEARGIGPNRYVLVGFGAGADGGGQAFTVGPGHLFNLLENTSLSLFGPTGGTALGSATVGNLRLPGSFLEATAAADGTHLVLLSGTGGAGGYSFRVLTPEVTTTPLTLDSLVSGGIGIPGEQDRYTFSLAQPTQVYFDALATDLAAMPKDPRSMDHARITLTGPAGTVFSNRSFTASDGPPTLLGTGSTNPVLNLLPGDYTLTVSRAAGDTGAYQFRLRDLAFATPLTPGTPVTGTLNPASETDLFQFTAAAGDRFFFDLVAGGGQARTELSDHFSFFGEAWKLVDPHGNLVFSTLFNGTSTSDVDVLTLAHTGVYTLFVEGVAVDRIPVTYTVNVQPAPVSPAALVLGDTVTSSIATAGEQDRYTFTLPRASFLYFDSLTNNTNLTWTLAGPAGTIVNGRSFTTSDAGSIINPAVPVPAGDYTLTIDLPGDRTGDYAFRLSELSSATPLVPGTAVSGGLDPAAQTNLYRFSASAGDRFFFDVQARASAGNANWRLLDPHGSVLFNTSFTATSHDVDVLTLPQPGTYTLLLEGRITDTEPGAYTFNVFPAHITPVPLTVGNLVAGALATPGAQDRYTFTLPGDALVYFDALTNNGNLNWTLVGPAGTVVNARDFSNIESRNPVLSLPAGDYALTLDLPRDLTGSYAFRVVDLSSAVPLVPGTAISGALDPANETDLYRFTAAAGDRFSFDLQARSNGGSSSWRLVDPYGNALFNRDFTATSSDVGPLTLSRAGTYTLLLEGAITDPGSGSYTFTVVPQGNTPPAPPPPATPLTLGSTVNAAISAAGERDHYTFTLGSAALAYFDALTNSGNFNWTLTGPAGTAVNARLFDQSDGGTGPINPVLSLVSGEYTLAVAASGTNTGNYAFRLGGLSSATPLIPGTAVSGALDPANETDLYRFTASAGDRFFFDVQARTGANNAVWRLVDPYGNLVFNTPFNSAASSDVDVRTLERSGTYTLLVEGRTSDTTAGSYALNVYRADVTPAPLTLGGAVNGSIATPGEQDRYTLTLPSAARLYFDSLTNSGSLTWSLTGNAGAVVNSRPFNSGENTNPVLNLPAGDYTLTIDVAGDQTGNYAFRLSDLASNPLTPGTPVSGELSPANETDVYSFSAAAGDRFFFDVQARSGTGNPRWRLVDPYGKVLFDASFFSTTTSDVDVLTLAQSGTYALLLEGGVADAGAAGYTINVRPVPPAGALPLTLGDVVSTAIATPGEQHRYTFRLAGAPLSQRLLYFDALTNNPGLTWTLTGPGGSRLNDPLAPPAQAPDQSRNFTASDGSSTTNPVFSMPAGDYTLTIDLPGDQTGPYAFRLVDLSSAAPLSPGTAVSGSFNPANETDLYRFDAAAGDRFFFDVHALNGASNAVWRLVDPYGAVLFNRPFVNTSLADADVLTLERSGTYTLLVEARISDTAPGSYAFNVHPAGVTPAPLALGGAVSGSVATPGDQDRYTFTLPGAARLYFDSLTNNAGLTWSLTGPAGSVVSGRRFDQSDVPGLPNPVLNLPAGDFTLTIDGTGDATAGYAFRLNDLASAAPVSPGTAESAGLSPANETDLYRFDAGAGDRFYFDLQAHAGAGNARWRLISPFGAVLFDAAFNSVTASDVDTLILGEAGTYTLLVEGAVADTSAGSYAFNVQPAPSSSTPLALGELVGGATGVAGEQDRHTFTLTSASLLYFDALTNNGSLTWTLAGPAGTAVNARSFTIGENNSPVLNLPAGDYTLTVDATGAATGPYAFRLSELSAATPLTPGTAVSGSLNPANETDLYRFTAAAGDRFSFDVQARAGAPSARWRLIDPYGNIVFNNFFATDVGATTLAQPGSHTLLLEGAVADGGSGSYTFAVMPEGSAPAPVLPPSTPLALGSIVDSSISAAGERDHYTFTLDGASLLYFDALTNSANFQWTLAGPAGTAVSNQFFTASDGGTGPTNPVLNLVAGDYTLTIAGTGSNTGSYSFRLSELSSAVALTPGTPASGSLTAANETDLYRFTAAAGDRFFFDVQARSGAPSAVWRLVDPYGNVLFNTPFANTSSSDVDVRTLAQPGSYTLLLEGRISDTAAGSYTVNVQPVTFGAVPLTFGLPAHAALSVPGEQDDYTFTGATGQRVFFHGMGTNPNLVARLLSPSGSTVFTVSANANSGPLFLPETGPYRLNFDAPGDAVGSYGFQLFDVATAPTLQTDRDTEGIIDPALENDLYRVDVRAGQTLAFVPGAGMFVGTAQQLSAATRRLVDSGLIEDGYDGIDVGLGHNAFRPGAAVNVVLITDEDRDVLNPSVTFGSTVAAVSGRDALLNSVLDARFRDGANQVALGVDSRGTAYLADGAGGFTTTAGGTFVSGRDGTKADYVDLTWALGGATWDLNHLRGGGLPAASFTKAFVAIKTREIEEQLGIDLVASDPGAGFQNLTGVRTGAGAGQTVSFDARITGDGTARSFDLLFVRQGSNLVLGSVPVTVNNDYVYPVRAVDADGDPLTFRLVEAPAGATIDAQTGRIAWEPPSAGTYRFVVQADDGRGGRDTQAYDVVVSAGAPNQAPAITSAAPARATAELPFAHAVTATDPDGDLLTYYLAEAPAGLNIDRTTGGITWTPLAAQTGSHTVRVRVLDGRGGEATQTFTLAVGADTANRPPQVVTTAATTATAGELYRYDADATDPDGDAVPFDLVVRPEGMTIDPTSGLVGWRPSPGDVGRHHVIVRARDGRGGVDLQSFIVTVTASGTPPVFSTPAPAAPAVVGRPYQFQFRTQDADGDAVTYRLDAAPAGMTIDANTGLLTWTPGADQAGAHGVVLTAIDNRGARGSLPFTLPVLAAAPNDPPAITSMPRTSVGLGTTYFYQIEAADPDNDPLTVTLSTAPAGMTIDAGRLIRWEPTAGQLGDSDVVVHVEDGRGGSVTQRFTVRVDTAGSNQPPRIVSTPVVSATVGRAYTYDLQGEDPDNDPLGWVLAAAPRGMSLNAALGTLRWTPAADQVGPADVVVRLYDLQGAFSTQSFTILVRAVNLAPAVVSAPPTQGQVGQPYTYAVRADDPEGDSLTFALTTAPAGMTVNGTTGLITWTPAPGQDRGVNSVAVLVSDGQGGSATQTFSVVAAEARTNFPPTITSVPGTLAVAGLAYHYDARAVDPDDDALTFALTAAPEGMTIDASSGAISWTPTASQVGSRRVTLTATDVAGHVATQRYTLVVLAENRPPVIDSEPVLPTTAGLVYRYDVKASDPDGNALTYRLTTAPVGMTIDDLGRITWSTGGTDVGTHAVTVLVTDPFGASASQGFELAVLPDTQLPDVILNLSTTRADLGSEVMAFVSATDNVGVEDLLLTLDGTPLVIDANGVAAFSADLVGTVEVTARATDAAGNTRTANATLTVIDPADVDAPAVALISPGGEAVVTAPTEVRGTAADDNLLLYTLSLAPLGSNQFNEFARGTAAVVDGVLGTLDPTLLPNDSYVLRLQATDAGGRVSTADRTVHVAGDLKLGNFALSFTDLTVPVFGVPISVTRTYDTLTANQSGDFGFGWRLEFRDMDLRTSVAPTRLEEYGVFNPLKVGSRVYVTLPGGNRQGFTFRPQVASGFRGGFLGIFEPRFEPDPGVKSSLTVTPADLRISADGRVFDYGTGVAYNPASGLFGGSYLLTTKDGVAFDIDGQTGQLTALSDTGNNTLRFSDAGIVGPEGRGISFERDPQGRITAVVDPAGQRIRYQYDAHGDLVGVTDRTNYTTQFAYRSGPAHYLEKVIDPLGRNGVRTEYDAQGRMVKLLDATGHPVQVAYDPANLVVTATDQRGNTIVQEYDPRGNVVREVDGLGGVTRRTFDADNNMLTEADPLGRTTTLTYNDRGDVLTRTDPLGNTTHATHQVFTYGTTTLAAVRGDAAAPFTRVKTSTDALGNTTTNAYDDAGNLTATRDPAGFSTVVGYDRPGRPPISLTDPNGGRTQFETRDGLLVRQVDPLGHATTYTYDAAGDQLTSTTTLTAADGTVRTLTTRTEYDAEGRVIKVTDAEGGVTRTEYDAAGNRTATVDPLGRRTEYRYDERDLLVETIFPDATPADLSDNPRTRKEYDAAGHETARIDELGRQTGYQYDAAGRLVKTVYADGAFKQVEYDAAGQETARIDERGNRTEFRYDDAGRQTAARDALGNETVTAYDAAGRRIAQTDALGRTTRFVFDARGIKAETVYPGGSRMTVAVDPRGQAVARTDQLNRTTRYEYDAAGRLTAVVDALGGRTEYGYDEAGNLIRQRDANGRVTQHAFDGLGRQTGTLLPALPGESPFSASRQYDAAGNLTAATDFNGHTITFAYDERDRLVEKRFPDGAAVTSTYTAAGQRATDTDGRGTTRYRYDDRDRLVSRTDPDGTAIAYAYDAAGNRTAVTTPAGTTRYTFDVLNGLATVTDLDGGATSYAYDAVGNLVRTERANGTVETRTYDGLNRLTLLENRNAAGVLSSHEYVLAATGRRDAVIEDGGRRVDYTYDALDRLTKEAITDAVLGDRTIEYTYDAAGNRLSRADSAEGTTTYTYDAMDRLLTEDLAGLIARYTYDRNGNTLSREQGGDAVSYAWDFENRLAAADTDGDGAFDVHNQYNPDGIRVAQTAGGAETRFLVDTVQPFPQVVLEYRPSGLILASYEYGNGLLSQTRDGVRSFYLADGLGSTRALTDAAGAVAARYVYDAFGRILSQSGGPANAYLFAGEQRDAALGLDYLRARFLDPRTGRFASADSFPGVIREPMSLHDYIYTAQNPVNLTDPSGHFFGGLIETAVSGIIQQTLNTLGSAIKFKTFIETARGVEDLLLLTTFGLQVAVEAFSGGFETGFTVAQHEESAVGQIKGIELKLGIQKGQDPILALELETKASPKFNFKLNLAHPEESDIELGQEFQLEMVTVTSMGVVPILQLALVLETQAAPSFGAKLGIEGKFGPGGLLKAKIPLLEI